MENGNQPLQSQSPPPTASPQLSIHKTRNLLKLLFIFIVIAAVFSSATYFLANQGFNITPSPTVAPQPTPTPDETANWKTYTNSRFGFSIQYPNGWKIEEDNPIKSDIVIYSSDNLSNLIIAPTSEARYTTERNRNKKLADGTHTLFAGRSSREYKEEFRDEFQSVFVRDIQIEDISGLDWTKPNEISYWVDKSTPELLKVFDQILSTFKFLDQKENCQPRPACLDEEPRCLLPEPADGWCEDQEEDQVACTQEAKLCPDGSYVGRVAPNCEFAPCPGISETSCSTDDDCGINVCGCSAMRKEFIGTGDICARYCGEVVPRCVNNYCVLVAR